MTVGYINMKCDWNVNTVDGIATSVKPPSLFQPQTTSAKREKEKKTNEIPLKFYFNDKLSFNDNLITQLTAISNLTSVCSNS